jgi:hypothetical protein
MSRRGNKTGHNQMLKRRRVKQLNKKRMVQAAKRTEKAKSEAAK